MTDVRLGVGVVGCGLIGTRRAAVAAAHTATRLIIAADLDSACAERVSRSHGAAATTHWEDVIAHPEVDIVIVATFHDQLAQISQAALAAGRHVLCEKPMSVHWRVAAETLAAARRSGRYLKVGFNHRHHPAIRRAREMCSQGAIGDLMFIRCRYGHGGRAGYELEWRLDPVRAGGGELMDQGIHAIDLFRWFLGDFSEVVGLTATCYWQTPVEDNAFVLFRTPGGQIASLHASWTQWKNLFSFEVCGREGAIVVEGLGGSYGTERLVVFRRTPAGVPSENREEFPGPDRSWEAEWDEFLTALREGAPPSDDGVEALKLVEAVYEATGSHRPVRVR